MFIFLPAGLKEISEKENWFKKDAAKNIKRKNFDFGFEIKGSVQNFKSFGEISYPYGIHLPNNLATDWRDSAKKEILQKEIEAANQMNALYAVLHGIKVIPIEKTYEKNAGFYRIIKTCPINLVSNVNAVDYLKAIEQFIDFVNFLENFGLPIAIENTAFTEFLLVDGIWYPETYFDLKIGNLHRDLKKIREKTGCKIVVDIEHLNFALNFIQRKFQYSSIPKKIPNFLLRDKYEDRVLKEFGFFLRDGLPLTQRDGSNFENELKSIGSKIYHIAGGLPGVGFTEYHNGKITSHAPIDPADKMFRNNLKIVLSQNPEILVLEVAGSNDNPCWDFRPVDALEKSFENLCKILDEEL